MLRGGKAAKKSPRTVAGPTQARSRRRNLKARIRNGAHYPGRLLGVAQARMFTAAGVVTGPREPHVTGRQHTSLFIAMAVPPLCLHQARNVA